MWINIFDVLFFIILAVLRKTTLISDSICKHVKNLRNCTLQAFKGASIRNIIDNITNGVINLHFNVIIIHVGTNDIYRLHLNEFEFLYHKLITSIRQVNVRAKVILSAILPRPVDFRETKHLIILVNNLLKTICRKRSSVYVTTYRPFLKFGKPICELFSPLCWLHVNHQGNVKLTIFLHKFYPIVELCEEYISHHISVWEKEPFVFLFSPGPFQWWEEEPHMFLFSPCFVRVGTIHVLIISFCQLAYVYEVLFYTFFGYMCLSRCTMATPHKICFF